MGQIPWVEYVPMLWGDKQIGDFQKNVKAGYARFVLGMNEYVFFVSLLVYRSSTPIQA